MEIKNQHQRNLYNFGFSVIFIAFILAQLGTIWTMNPNPSLNLTDFILLSLAIFRITRLFVYDDATGFIRDLFIDIREEHGQLVRTKKPFGVERALSDIFSCPWCFSIWGGSVLVWLYLMFPAVMMYVALILALSAIASFLQLSANLLGWKAEHQKMIVERERQ